MILPLFGGVFMDKLGIRVGIPLFVLILAIGQFIFAIGGYKASFSWMMTGRFIYGLGGENMLVGQQAVISNWFKGRELVMAFGITASILRFGSFANGPLMNKLANEYSVGFSFMIGFVICIFSLIMGIFLVIVDSYAARKDKAVT